MIGLGYDPGYGTGGAAAVQDCGAAGYLILHAETIRTDTKLAPPQRYRWIASRLATIVQLYQPHVAGVEDQLAVWAGQSRDRRTNAKALHGLVCQGLLHGVVACSVHELTPKQVKQAVAGHGAGHAGKGQIRTAVELIRRTGNVKRLSSHSADAVAVAIGALRRERVARATS